MVPNSVFCSVLARLNFLGRIPAVGAEIGTKSLSLFTCFVADVRHVVLMYVGGSKMLESFEDCASAQQTDGAQVQSI